VGQEGAVRCGGAGGARNWRGGAAEAVDGSGQRSSGKVVKRRRKKNRNAGARKGIEEGRSSLGGKQLLMVDGARGGSGEQWCDASARGGASGVGRAASRRAGGQAAQEER
jgi:hypothetical protein